MMIVECDWNRGCVLCSCIPLTVLLTRVNGGSDPGCCSDALFRSTNSANVTQHLRFYHQRWKGWQWPCLAIRYYRRKKKKWPASRIVRNFTFQLQTVQVRNKKKPSIFSAVRVCLCISNRQTASSALLLSPSLWFFSLSLSSTSAYLTLHPSHNSPSLISLAFKRDVPRVLSKLV